MKKPTSIKDIEDNLEDLNKNCNAEYGTPKFPPEVNKFLRQQITELLEQIDSHPLFESLGKCGYDHNGTCQEHFLENPCCVSEFKNMINNIKK